MIELVIPKIARNMAMWTVELIMNCLIAISLQEATVAIKLIGKKVKT